MTLPDYEMLKACELELLIVIFKGKCRRIYLYFHL